MASPRRVSRVLYLLARGRRAATTRAFAEPELAHEMRERVGEARRRQHLRRAGPRPPGRRRGTAADEPRKRRRRLEGRRRSAAMNQRTESEHAAEARPQQPRIPEEAGGFAKLLLFPQSLFRLSGPTFPVLRSVPRGLVL